MANNLSESETRVQAEEARRAEIWKRGIDPSGGGKYICVQCGNSFPKNMLQHLFLRTGPALNRTTFSGRGSDKTDDKNWVPAFCCPDCINNIAAARAGVSSASTSRLKGPIPPDDVVGILTW